MSTAARLPLVIESCRRPDRVAWPEDALVRDDHQAIASPSARAGR